MVMSRSEAGRIGGERLRQIRRNQYEQTPAYCKECKKPKSYENRRLVFCSQECFRRAAINRLLGKISPRLGTGKLPPTKDCLVCGKPYSSYRSSGRLYCSRSCTGARRKEEAWTLIEQGKVTERGTLKRHLLARRGHFCAGCDRTEWKTSLLPVIVPIPLELDHVDGNAGNNHPNNLRLLCPTCHAVTPTAKGKNRGNGRAARGIARH
jgi:hypothetical protein